MPWRRSAIVEDVWLLKGRESTRPPCPQPGSARIFPGEWDGECVIPQAGAREGGLVRVSGDDNLSRPPPRLTKGSARIVSDISLPCPVPRRGCRRSGDGVENLSEVIS